MRTNKAAAMGAALALLLCINCSTGSNPISPDVPMPTSHNAVVSGTVTIAGADVAIGAIQLNLKGTNQRTSPNDQGNFSFGDVPPGDQIIEVLVKEVLSDIPVVNVQTEEQIRMRLEIRTNCQAVVAEMERYRKSQGPLLLEIQPKKWNLDWEENEEWVTARVSGNGYNTIVPDSVILRGPEGDELTMVSTEYELGGTYFKARFKKMDALALIPDAMPGMSYLMILVFTYTDSAGAVVADYELTDAIEIVGKYPKDSEDLALQVNPDKWNTNWIKSSGTVMVKLWGDGFDAIIADDVRLVEPVSGNTTGSPLSFNLTDDQLIVRFSKQEAIALFAAPLPGETYVIKVTDDPISGGTFAFDYAVSVVGSKK